MESNIALTEAGAKAAVCDLARNIRSTGLSITGSNVSCINNNNIYITPRGLDLAALSPEDIAVISITHNETLFGNPSRESAIHKAVYELGQKAKFIIHTHSPYATALSCCRITIPSFHFMVAAFGGDSIRCSEYATFGSERLSGLVKAAMLNRKACLMANHGAIVAGESSEKALHLALELEGLCKIYAISRLLGEQVLLSQCEMEEAISLLS